MLADDARQMVDSLQRHDSLTATALLRAPLFGVVDEHAAHRPRRHRQEMITTTPLDAIEPGEPEIRLMNQRIGLERVPGAFPGELPVGDAAQALMQQREYLAQRHRVAFASPVKQLCNVARLARARPLLHSSSDVQPVVNHGVRATGRPEHHRQFRMLIHTHEGGSRRQIGSPRAEALAGLPLPRFSIATKFGAMPNHLLSRVRRGAVLVVGLLTTAVLNVAPAQQATNPSALTARPSPEWVRQAVVYEVNERAFSDAGTFNAITNRLDDLKKLGVSVLWLMPVHPIGQLNKKGSIGSPYAVRDYYDVNPAFGTKDDLKRLVRAAHQRGLKVIIDIVANHTAWDAVMMKTPTYYVRDASGKVLSPYDWTDVAKLDYSNSATRRYMLDMLEMWIREYDLDGFRCDVAGDVPTTFWDEARDELARIKPDIFMLAEAHKPDLLVKAFDMDYSWPLYGALAAVVEGGRPAALIRGEWEAERATYPRGALHLRFTENHDEKRAIARFGERGALAAAALMFTLDGVPLMYNGQEAGDVTESGAPALFEKMAVFWQGAERRPEIVAFFKDIIPLRRAHPALLDGSVQWVANSDYDRVLTYLRHSDREDVLVAVNLSNKPFFGTVEAPGSGFTEITPRPPNQPVAGAERPIGLPALSLDAWGYRMFLRRP
jgi:cyclomaltodextrinase